MTESAARTGTVSETAARMARVVGFRIISLTEFTELTESERSGERLPKAARRVSGSDSILGSFDRMIRLRKGNSGGTGQDLQE